ncbi:MAG: squalene/phytoene synthase family protein [Desulfatitalea sp.]|nr:squalene/phytoene synthase family protein [Desulfatitalea sp.]
MTTSIHGIESRLLQQVSRSFALTIPQLPEGLIKPVTNAYLICRIVDTIEDETQLSIDQKRIFFDQFGQVIDGTLPADKFAGALHPLLSARTLPAEHELVRRTSDVMHTFFSLSDAQRQAIHLCARTMSRGMLEFQKKQNFNGLETLAQMNEYCYYVAGVVGDMLTRLFCAYSEAIAARKNNMVLLAASFGQGLQMTNIIKDLWEDKARGVCWLPKDLFRQSGFDLASLSPHCFDPCFGQGLGALIGVAHGHLRNALAYSLLLPRSETGIRKFCLWAIGLAIFTLKKINRKRDYTCSRDIKISRERTGAILAITNACIHNDVMLKLFFQMATRGLPLSVDKATTGRPDSVRLPEQMSADPQR